MSVLKVPRSDDRTNPSEYCRRLERGDIAFFDRVPFTISHEDLEFLLSARQENTRLHKNISYRPEQNVLRGSSVNDRATSERLRQVMRRYSAAATGFLDSFLQPYARTRQLDYASFRPIEEAGRELPLHKRNELLHVDAFPSRPTWGGRILRFFTNINPTTTRIWEIGADFSSIAKTYAADAGLIDILKRHTSFSGQAIQRSREVLSRAGLPLPRRSAYDQFMLRFHDYLKENSEYQARGFKRRLEFPSNTSWIVFTDCVPHSVLSGQFALEQTFIIPFDALVDEDSSPARILQRLAGADLTAN